MGGDKLAFPNTLSWRRAQLKKAQGQLYLLGSDGMDRINLAQNRVQWRILMNIVMSLRVP